MARVRVGRRSLSGTMGAALIAAFVSPALPASAQPASPGRPAVKSDVRHVEPGALDKLTVKDSRGRALAPASPAPSRAAAPSLAAGVTPPVGTVRPWIAIDFNPGGGGYLKNFVLRGAGTNVEVWVAEDIQFPAGDCRNGVRTEITDSQVAYFINEFDTNIYPVESAAFSVPPDRDGSGSPLAPELDFSGAGEKIVTLIDNVVDENFIDTNNAHSLTYVAGFFSGGINELTDRNVMTIDAFDWLHRTGDNPPDEASTDPCTNAPARPFLYEGVFAHEYQHLLLSYEDPDEVNWVNEGLSDYAQSITGYVDTRPSVFEPRYDNHVQCFLGFLTIATPFNTIPRASCGPENSLTLWGDQGDGEILADYGAAYTMMEFLAGRYGHGFLSALHDQDANGFAGLQAVLDASFARTTAAAVLHDWAAMVALDGVLDDGARLIGGRRANFRTPTLDASILWDNEHAYASPGAPPNGSDYVRLRKANGRYFGAHDIKRISFDGASTLDPQALEWTLDDAPPGGTTGPALFSGTGDNLDRSIVRSVAVPAGSPTLVFDTRWDTEPAFDSGFVQISTDGGATYTSLGNADTTSELDPGADQRLVDNLPGFNGDSAGWRSETFDLSAYAGQTVLLAFHYISDVNTNGLGWWVDNVTVGGTLLSDGSTLDGWQTKTQVRPVPVAGFTVQLIGYSDDHRVAGIVRLPIDANFDGSLRIGRIRSAFSRRVKTVAAIVMYDDPTETSTQYARYELKVNGVLQPGG